MYNNDLDLELELLGTQIKAGRAQLAKQELVRQYPIDWVALMINAVCLGVMIIPLFI